MPSAKPFTNLQSQVESRPGAAERLAQLRQETLAEIGLYELRRALEVSQTELAAALEVSQSAISQLESGRDIKISTLRNYVGRLGGEVRITAVFGEQEQQTEIPISFT